MRCAKLALDRGDLGRARTGPSAYFMKSPPIQYTTTVAREMTEAFIRGEALPGYPYVSGKGGESAGSAAPSEAPIAAEEQAHPNGAGVAAGEQED